MFGELKNLANIMQQAGEGMNVPGLQDAIAKIGMG